MKHLSVSELKSMMERHDRVQVIDVRSPGEYASGHIPGAMNLPLEELEARLDDIERNAPVVLVCRSGRRSGLACETLNPHRDRVMSLDGGVESWTQSGLPFVRAAKATWSIERQVRLTAGLLMVMGLLLAHFVHPAWVALSAFVGVGLTFAGLTGWCGMALLFGAMPWNKPNSCAPQAAAQGGSR